jgi:protein-tyrosine phosphatase
MKILMVCLGNICRSPLAAGILQHKADEAGLEWQVESTGTSNYHIGDPPHKLSQKVALLNGVDISNQRGSRFTKEDMLTFDRIYVMDSDNYNEVRRMSGDAWNADKADLILNELYPGKNTNVPDPWFGTEQGYHEVYDMLDKACEKIVERWS